MKINLLLRVVLVLQAAFFFFPLYSQQTSVNQKSKSNNFLDGWYEGIGEAVSIKKYGNQENTSDSESVLRYAIQKIFDKPDEDYVSRTTKMDISGIEDQTMVYSVDGEDFTITFDAPMRKQSPESWLEWAYLPDVEEEKPHFLWGFYTELELNFSKPVCLFGMEVATGYYGTFPITLELYNNTTLIGKVTRTVVDLAALFAVEVPGEIPVTRAVIKVPFSAFGVGIANLRFSDKCDMAPSGIIVHPRSVSVCQGGSHTFSVSAEGEDLIYQWYKGNNKIFGANASTLTITDASYEDYDQYYVMIKDGISTFYSNRVTLWVADPLPNILAFSKFPEVVYPNQSYTMKLAGYMGVTNYSWKFSNVMAGFAQQDTKVNENTFVTSATPRIGTVYVELEHVCGNRTLSKRTEFYPTGLEEVRSNTLQVYPNPTADVVKISGCNSELQLYNMSGVLLGSYLPNDGTAEINLSHFSKGIYLIKCNGKLYKVIRK